MSHFTRILTPLEGLVVIERHRIEDERGFFSRFFCCVDLEDFGWRGAIAQINHTLTRNKGAVRGMHFQRPPHEEAKFVSCVRGAVFDVAVDLRRESPTYLRWHGEVLSAENVRSMMIPAGFAHGFQSLTEDCELIYLHDRAYAAGAEGGLNPLDPALNISWPVEVAQLSARDRSFALLANISSGLLP